jgi:ADP-ribose pyrophosphatase YjhB (NUDIX family)
LREEHSVTTKTVSCPGCGYPVRTYRNPLLTVDIIIRIPGKGIVLIERKNPPYGWALPGGFVDYGESLETAARREAKEETDLELEEIRQFRAYSSPDRDPRHHTVSVVFTAVGKGNPRARDDAANLGIFSADALPGPLAFDHARILSDFFEKSESVRVEASEAPSKSQ